MDLSEAACKQKLKIHLLDAVSAESDAVDHPLLHSSYCVYIKTTASVTVMMQTWASAAIHTTQI